MFVIIDKDTENNVEKINDIVKNSNPNKESKMGFWMFEEEINKSSLYLDFEKYGLKYIISYDDNNKPVAMELLSYNYFSLNGDKDKENYVYILCIESLKKGEGSKILKYTINKLKNKENKEGIELTCYNKDLVSYYSKFGFALVNSEENQNNPVMIKHFDKVLNSNLTESYAMDPNFGSSMKINQYGGYVYKILPFIPTLQGNKNTEVCYDRYIHTGSRIKSKDKHNRDVVGRVYRIVKDEDGYITNVLVFNENTHRVTDVIPEHLILLEKMNESLDEKINEKYSIEKAKLCESVKKNGPIVVSSSNNKSSKLLFTLNEGSVKMFNINTDKSGKEYISKITDIFDVNENLISKINKAKSNASKQTNMIQEKNEVYFEE